VPFNHRSRQCIGIKRTSSTPPSKGTLWLRVPIVSAPYWFGVYSFTAAGPTASELKRDQREPSNRRLNHLKLPPGWSRPQWRRLAKANMPRGQTTSPCWNNRPARLGNSSKRAAEEFCDRGRDCL
jgi:hypothetical protein